MFRKIMSLILCACMVLFVVLPVSASDIDFKSMSIEELQDLKTRIDKEILDRQGFSMWFDYGIGQYIPKIILQSGKEPELDSFQINDEYTMYVTIKNHDETDFDAYVDQLITLGFTENIDRSRFHFAAKNSDGYSVEVNNWSSSGISVKGYPPAKKK